MSIDIIEIKCFIQSKFVQLCFFFKRVVVMDSKSFCAAVLPMTTGQCPRKLNVQVEGWCRCEGGRACVLYFRDLGLSASTPAKGRTFSPRNLPSRVLCFFWSEVEPSSSNIQTRVLDVFLFISINFLFSPNEWLFIWWNSGRTFFIFTV